MTSRLTASAVAFAVLATASLAFAVNLQSASIAEAMPTVAAAAGAQSTPVRVIHLPRVTVTAKREDVGMR